MARSIAMLADFNEKTQARRGVKLVTPVVDTDPHQYSLKTTFGQHDAGHAFPGLQNDVLIGVGSRNASGIDKIAGGVVHGNIHCPSKSS